MKLARYQVTGFIPVNDAPATRRMLAATVTIVKGEVLADNGSGYATNNLTAFTALCFGVAAAGVVGDSSTKYVEYYPFDTKTQYSVPVSTNAVLTVANKGDICDLGTNADDLSIATNFTAGIGFRIDDIDISAAAIAANTYGYAIGHFQTIAAQA